MKIHPTLILVIIFTLIMGSTRPVQASGKLPPPTIVSQPGPCTGWSTPTSLIEKNGVVYFTATDGGNDGEWHGRQIWRSDGSESGTWRATDVVSTWEQGIRDLKIVSGGKLYFTIGNPDSSSSKEWLWVTDASPAVDGEAGAVQLLDFLPEESITTLTAFTELGGALFFVVNNDPDDYASRRSELWTTNGTDGGTRMIFAFDATLQVAKMVAFDGLLYFFAYDETNGANLWRSNGTTAGTARFTNTGGGYAWDGDLEVAGSRLFFTFVDTYNGTASLWITNGTLPGTSSVYTFPQNSTPGEFTAFQDGVYFNLQSGAGSQLWLSDGTGPGTQMLKQFVYNDDIEGPLYLTPLDSELYFAASETAKDSELWKTDGTPAGTVRVSDLRPGETGSQPFALTTAGGRLYFFTSKMGDFPEQLWVTGGTVEGVQKALQNDINRNPNSALPEMVSSGNRLFFSAPVPCQGWEIQVIDTPGSEPRVVKDIQDDLIPLYVQPVPVDHQGITYFIADDHIHGSELWRSDGTPEGTHMAKDIRPTGSGLRLDGPLPVSAGNFLYFSAADPQIVGRTQLWRTDGTEPGTQLITTLEGSISFMQAYQGTLLFFLESELDLDLWRSDGSLSGTHRLASLPASAQGMGLNGKQYFLLYAYDTDLEIWETDGTTPGTRRTVLIGYQSHTYPRSELVRAGDMLYFQAYDDESSLGLWATNGTASATHQIADFSAVDFSFTPGSRNLYVFTDNENEPGYKLWKTRGAENDLTLLFETTVGTLVNCRAAGNRLFWNDFMEGQNDGSGLWTSNGAPGGTVQLMHAGGDPQHFSQLEPAGANMYFIAQTAANGQELWMSDGSPSGTRLVADLWPGPSSSNAWIFGYDGTRLWFDAADGTTPARSHSAALIYSLDVPSEMVGSNVYLPIVRK